MTVGGDRHRQIERGAVPAVETTGYGLGKKGWVTASFEPGDRTSVELLSHWIEESYRSIAPKKRVAELDLKKPR